MRVVTPFVCIVEIKREWVEISKYILEMKKVVLEAGVIYIHDPALPFPVLKMYLFAIRAY